MSELGLILSFYIKNETSSPSGMPRVVKDSKTAFYENVECDWDKNSSITLNEKGLSSSGVMIGYKHCMIKC